MAFLNDIGERVLQPGDTQCILLEQNEDGCYEELCWLTEDEFEAAMRRGEPGIKFTFYQWGRNERIL